MAVTDEPERLGYESPPAPAPRRKFWRGRILGALALLPPAAFCGFGFLASFEPGTPVVMKFAYAATGLACLALAVWLIGKK